MKTFSHSRDCLNACADRIQSTVRGFSPGYWRFFVAAFCMDLGFGLFFFLFSLYLTDLGFSELFIGQVVACLTLGNVAGTIPATFIARRKGLRPLLLVTFAAVPLVCMLRILIVWPHAQLALAFFSGVGLCGWPICFSPTIAALTDERNRAKGLSIGFAAGIGLGTIAGIVGGHVPEILNHTTLRLPMIDGIRIVLFVSCVITALGLVPLRALSLPHVPPSERRHVRLFNPFLKRFLPGFLLWNIVTSSFPVFGAVFLQKSLGMPLGELGVVFSASQFMQFTAVALAPLLFQRLGIAKGVAVAQLGTALMLLLMSRTQTVALAVSFYLIYFATQFMCSPGIYSLLMDSVPAAERSSASAVQNLSGALCQAGSAALTGIGIVNLGYHKILIVNAIVALLAALTFFLLGRRLQIPVDHGGTSSSTGRALAVGTAPYAREAVE